MVDVKLNLGPKRFSGTHHEEGSVAIGARPIRPSGPIVRLYGEAQNHDEEPGRRAV
jgi:hypothetical protein